MNCSWANGCVKKRIHWLLESVSYEWANGLDKRQKNWGKLRMARSEAIKIQCEEINRNCALRCSCADFCDRIKQYGDKELWKWQHLHYFNCSCFLGTDQWVWAGFRHASFKGRKTGGLMKWQKSQIFHSKIATVWQNAGWQACSTAWVQFPGHNPVGLGRILVLDRRAFNRIHMEKCGQFGM